MASRLFLVLLVASFWRVTSTDETGIVELLMKTVSKSQLEWFLSNLTTTMHRAGTPQSLAIADYIHGKFEEFGLTTVETEDYQVLLSQPDASNPDKVTLLSGNGEETTISEGLSDVLEASEGRSPDAKLQYLAFSKPGTVASKRLVYANYGAPEDFKFLLDRGMSINGSIVLMRYGQLWRGTKIRMAQAFGAIGAILFSDPVNYHGQDHQTVNDTFPHNNFLPPSDVQRGTVSAEDNGDILTPSFPSKDYVIRKTIDEARKSGKLPDIPATVIGYADATKLLQEMKGEKAPFEWRGALPTVYNLGPNLKDDQSIRLTVNNRLETGKIRNVIGYLKGAVEPDRYVIIGNHHDAWTYGGLDPSSGTAALLETARVLASMVKSRSWQPRRTVMFCAWDAEEYGLIGSTEYVEQNLARLQNQAIAYINIDTAVTGNYSVFARGSALLKSALFEAAKRVPNPNKAESSAESIFDSWSRASQSRFPSVYTLIGSGSDYKPFMHYAGIPVMDLRYGSSDRGYPLYHTLHDTMFSTKHFVDPDFIYHEAITRLWAEYARILADSPVVPLNVDDLSKDISEQYSGFINKARVAVLPFPVNMDPLAGAVSIFRKNAIDFSNRLQILQTEVQNQPSNSDKLFAKLRFYNDRLTLLDRFFILPQGTPVRPTIRHCLYGPDLIDSYSGVFFPGLSAGIRLATSTKIASIYDTDRQIGDHRAMINDQISSIATSFYAAAEWLEREF